MDFEWFFPKTLSLSIYPFAQGNFDLTHPKLNITFIARKILN